MSRMNALIIVIPDLVVDGFDELTDVVEPFDVAKLKLEVVVE